MLTSKNGMLDLEEVDINEERKRYETAAGRPSTLTSQQWIDFMSIEEAEDPLDDAELVTAVQRWERGETTADGAKAA